MKHLEERLKNRFRYDVATSIYKKDIGFGGYDFASEKLKMTVRKFLIKGLRYLFDRKKSDQVIVRYLRYLLWSTKSYK